MKMQVGLMEHVSKVCGKCKYSFAYLQRSENARKNARIVKYSFTKKIMT